MQIRDIVHFDVSEPEPAFTLVSGYETAAAGERVYGEMASVRASAAYSGFRFVLKMHKLVGRHK